MARDYTETIAALRRKAADKAVTKEEAKLLLNKADELEAKYAKPEVDYRIIVTGDIDDNGYMWVPYNRNPTPHAPPQTFTNNDDDTVVTSHSGQDYSNAASSWSLNALLKMQAAWNKPPVEDDSTETDYQFSETDTYDRHWTATENEDYGYEEYQ